MTKLYQWTSKCEFRDLCNSLIKDILIVGLKDLHPKEYLLREPVIMKAIQADQVTKERNRQAKELKTSETQDMDVAFIKEKHKNRPRTLSQTNCK